MDIRYVKGGILKILYIILILILGIIWWNIDKEK
jgi:di/tricarboxylate transporter